MQTIFSGLKITSYDLAESTNAENNIPLALRLGAISKLLNCNDRDRERIIGGMGNSQESLCEARPEPEWGYIQE